MCFGDSDDAPLCALALAGDDAPSARAIITTQVCTAAGDYNRRFIELRVDCWPLRLLWLVHRRPDQCCPDRQATAQALLDANPPLDHTGRPERNAGRLKTVFSADIGMAASTGKLSCRLHAFLCTVRRRWQADTQRQEGKNKDIQATVGAAPRISLALLSDRVLVKSRLNNDALYYRVSGDSKSDRHAMQRAVKSVVEDCARHFPCADAVMQLGDRWAPCETVDIDMRHIELPRRIVNKRTLFAGCYHGVLAKHYPTAAPWTKIFVFLDSTGRIFSPHCYACFVTSASVAHFQVGRLDGDAGDQTATILRPFEYISSRKLLESQQWQVVEANCSVSWAYYAVRRWPRVGVAELAGEPHVLFTMRKAANSKTYRDSQR